MWVWSKLKIWWACVDDSDEAGYDDDADEDNVDEPAMRYRHICL